MYLRFLVLGMTAVLASCNELPVEKVAGRYKISSLEVCMLWKCEMANESVGIEFNFTHTQLPDGREQVCFDYYDGKPKCMETDEIHERSTHGAFTSTRDYLAKLVVDTVGFNFQSSNNEKVIISKTEEVVSDEWLSEDHKFFRTQEGFFFVERVTGSKGGFSLSIKSTFKLELVAQ